MESIRIFEKDDHKNWLKGVVSLRCLQEPLKHFIDRQVGIFHQEVRNKCDFVQCDKKCDLRNWKPRPNQIPSFDCPACSRWSNVMWANHNNQRGKVMWMNSEPHLWAQKKWEVAKVYMGDGHRKHKSIDDFDIHALLSLMTQCKHFKIFELGTVCEEVTSFRNKIMHSSSLQLKTEDMHRYFHLIRALGDALAKHDTAFITLSQDIDEIQNLDFRLMLPADKILRQRGKELEDMLFEAVQLANECDQKIQTLRRSYKNRLRRQQEMIAQRDINILSLHSAVAQEADEHAHTRMRLEKLERELAQRRQEIRHSAPCQRRTLEEFGQMPEGLRIVPVVLAAVTAIFMSILSLL
ncbi:uncharacterized protein CXorf38 homolog [Enoplosus armatus]|uniref:uncharacterized protein CXorf38 homolog n=1 Tax=Enoplosus armatus TaxID=215367 RepID=UPI003991FB90